RSRGASREQILGALLVQNAGMGVVALGLGPLLSILAVRLLMQHSLSSTDQGALNIILAHPFFTAFRLGLISLTTVGIALLAMCFAVFRAARANALKADQETGGSARR